MSGWHVTLRSGRDAQWCSDEFPDWHIYEQTAGFFVWREFSFHSDHATFRTGCSCGEGGVLMRQFWADLKQALYEFRHPTWEQEDRPDLEADAAVRTEWVRNHRHPEGR